MERASYSDTLPGKDPHPGTPPPPLSGGATAADPNSEVEIGALDLLQRAFAVYKQHAKLLIAVAAVVLIPGALIDSCARAAILAPTVAVGGGIVVDPVTHLPIGTLAVGTVAGLTAALLGMLAAAVTGFFLHGIVVPMAHAALALAAADRSMAGHADWREVWRWLLKRLGTLLSALIPAALLTGVGFFFLVLPGLVLAFVFAFVPTVAVFENLGGTAALYRSFVLVRSDWLRVLLVMICLAVVTALAQFIAGLISASLFGARLLQDLLTLVAMPIPIVAMVLLYFDVRRKHDLGGFGTEQLIHEMDALRGP